MLVEVTGALFGYGTRPVVRVDQLHLHAGRCAGIFGPNGAGKTTLVRGITGLLPPLTGSVVRDPGNAGLRIAYMPQHRALELQWPMTGFDAAAMATSAHRRFGWVGHARKPILAMMETLGVRDLASRPFARLSGGQQQRVLLAGAMACEPGMLVLDEPTDGLDVHSTQLLLDLLRDFIAKGLCTVIISHEFEDLLYLCQEVAWLHPADVAGHASHVEMISPTELAGRMLNRRRSQ